MTQYQILYKEIKALIFGGILKEGDLLSSENELCEKYKVTRSTVRKALDMLVHEGYIIKKQGKGSIIRLKRNSLGLLSFRGFSDVLEDNSHNYFSILLQDPILIHWPRNFFYPLTVEENSAKTYFISRLRFVNDQPVMLEYTYLPNIQLDNFLVRPLVKNSLFHTLRSRYHIEVKNVSQDLRAIAADESVAGLLKYFPGAPLVHIYRKYQTSRKGLNIYSSLYCNTEKYYLSNDFS